MTLNHINIVQSGNDSNVYSLFLPQNICIAQIAMPPDGQYMHDTKVLEWITKALAARWEVNNKSR